MQYVPGQQTPVGKANPAVGQANPEGQGIGATALAGQKVLAVQVLQAVEDAPATANAPAPHGEATTPDATTLHMVLEPVLETKIAPPSGSRATP